MTGYLDHRPDLVVSGINQGTIYNLGPYTITASATDASLISQVTLYYTVNGGAINAITMNNTIDSLYEASIPTVNDGDVVCYFIEAFDAGLAPPVVLESTHRRALDFVSLEQLQSSADTK